MIEAIYIAMILFYLLLTISIIFRSYIIGSLSSMGLIICGVFILSGLTFITNFLVTSMGIINVSVGSFMFIQGSLEQIQQY